MREISLLLKHIEDGNNLSARTLAVVIHRLIFSEFTLLGSNTIKIRSYLDQTIGVSNASPYVLTTFEVSQYGTRVVPIVLHSSDRFRLIDLKEWKNEMAFDGQAARGLYNPSGIPLKILSREAFLNYARNEIGAHFDREISGEHQSMTSSFKQFNLRVTAKGETPVVVTPDQRHHWNYLSATISTIGFEVLKSFSEKSVGSEPK